MRLTKTTFLSDNSLRKRREITSSFANTYISHFPSTSFIEQRDGSLKRRRQKFNYKDIYLERKDFCEIILQINEKRRKKKTTLFSSIDFNPKALKDNLTSKRGKKQFKKDNFVNDDINAKNDLTLNSYIEDEIEANNDSNIHIITTKEEVFIKQLEENIFSPIKYNEQFIDEVNNNLVVGEINELNTRNKQMKNIVQEKENKDLTNKIELKKNKSNKINKNTITFDNFVNYEDDNNNKRNEKLYQQIEDFEEINLSNFDRINENKLTNEPNKIENKRNEYVKTITSPLNTIDNKYEHLSNIQVKEKNQKGNANSNNDDNHKENEFNENKVKNHQFSCKNQGYSQTMKKESIKGKRTTKEINLKNHENNQMESQLMNISNLNTQPCKEKNDSNTKNDNECDFNVNNNIQKQTIISKDSENKQLTNSLNQSERKDNKENYQTTDNKNEKDINNNKMQQENIEYNKNQQQFEGLNDINPKHKKQIENLQDGNNENNQQKDLQRATKHQIQQIIKNDDHLEKKHPSNIPKKIGLLNDEYMKDKDDNYKDYDNDNEDEKEEQLIKQDSNIFNHNQLKNSVLQDSYLRGTEKIILIKNPSLLEQQRDQLIIEQINKLSKVDEQKTEENTKVQRNTIEYDDYNNESSITRKKDEPDLKANKFIIDHNDKDDNYNKTNLEIMDNQIPMYRKNKLHPNQKEVKVNMNNDSENRDQEKMQKEDKETNSSGYQYVYMKNKKDNSNIDNDENYIQQKGKTDLNNINSCNKSIQQSIYELATIKQDNDTKNTEVKQNKFNNQIMPQLLSNFDRENENNAKYSQKPKQHTHRKTLNEKDSFNQQIQQNNNDLIKENIEDINEKKIDSILSQSEKIDNNTHLNPQSILSKEKKGKYQNENSEEKKQYIKRFLTQLHNKNMKDNEKVENDNQQDKNENENTIQLEENIEQLKQYQIQNKNKEKENIKENIKEIQYSNKQSSQRYNQPYDIQNYEFNDIITTDQQKTKENINDNNTNRLLKVINNDEMINNESMKKATNQEEKEYPETNFIRVHSSNDEFEKNNVNMENEYYDNESNIESNQEINSKSLKSNQHFKEINKNSLTQLKEKTVENQQNEIKKQSKESKLNFKPKSLGINETNIEDTKNNTEKNKAIDNYNTSSNDKTKTPSITTMMNPNKHVIKINNLKSNNTLTQREGLSPENRINHNNRNKNNTIKTSLDNMTSISQNQSINKTGCSINERSDQKTTLYKSIISHKQKQISSNNKENDFHNENNLLFRSVINPPNNLLQNTIQAEYDSIVYYKDKRSYSSPKLNIKYSITNNEKYSNSNSNSNRNHFNLVHKIDQRLLKKSNENTPCKSRSFPPILLKNKTELNNNNDNHNNNIENDINKGGSKKNQLNTTLSPNEKLRIIQLDSLNFKKYSVTPLYNKSNKTRRVIRNTTKRFLPQIELSLYNSISITDQFIKSNKITTSPLHTVIKQKEPNYYMNKLKKDIKHYDYIQKKPNQNKVIKNTRSKNGKLANIMPPNIMEVTDYKYF